MKTVVEGYRLCLLDKVIDTANAANEIARWLVSYAEESEYLSLDSLWRIRDEILSVVAHAREQAHNSKVNKIAQLSELLEKRDESDTNTSGASAR